MVVGRLQEERYTEFVQHNSSLSDQAKSIASYAEVSFTVLVPPPPLFFLNRGLFDKAELAFKASRIEPPQLRSRSSRGSWLDDLFPALDVASLVEMLFSLIPFIFAYGRFSGEKENGTLKILLVNPISRFHLLLGRMIGLAIALIPALLTTGLVCWAYVLLTPFLRSQMLYRDWMAFLAFFAISTLFGMTNLQVAVLVSALTDRSSSTLLCLVGWLLASIVIVPTLGLEITEKVLPSPSTRAGIAEERRLHASALHACLVGWLLASIVIVPTLGLEITEKVLPSPSTRAGIAEERRLHASALHAYHEAISYALDRDLHIEPLALERPGTQMFMYRYGNQRLGFKGTDRCSSTTSANERASVSLEFPRFRGHLILWENGGYDAKNKTSLSTRVSPADSRASSSRAQTR